MPTQDDRTAYLKALMPEFAFLDERTENGQFAGWEVYRFHKGLLAPLRNWKEKNPIVIISADMTSYSLFKITTLAKNVVENLKKGIQAEYQISIIPHRESQPYVRDSY